MCPCRNRPLSEAHCDVGLLGEALNDDEARQDEVQSSEALISEARNDEALPIKALHNMEALQDEALQGRGWGAKPRDPDAQQKRANLGDQPITRPKLPRPAPQRCARPWANPKNSPVSAINVRFRLLSLAPMRRNRVRIGD